MYGARPGGDWPRVGGVGIPAGSRAGVAMGHAGHDGREVIDIYEYEATLIRVVDGDTVWVALDLGLDVTIHVSLRLVGIDAPELRNPGGQEARTFLTRLLPTGVRALRVMTTKDRREKYGRYLARILLPLSDGTMLLDVNQEMIARGHARVYP